MTAPSKLTRLLLSAFGRAAVLLLTIDIGAYSISGSAPHVNLWAALAAGALAATYVDLQDRHLRRKLDEQQRVRVTITRTPAPDYSAPDYTGPRDGQGPIGC